MVMAPRYGRGCACCFALKYLSADKGKDSASCSLSLTNRVQYSQASSPSVFGSGRDGRQYLKGRPGRTGILASVQTTARDGLVGTAGVSGGAISG